MSCEIQPARHNHQPNEPARPGPKWTKLPSSGQIWSFLGKNPKFYWRNQKFCYPPPGHFGQKMIFRGLFEKKVIKNFAIGAFLSPWMRIGWDPKYCSALSLFLKFFLHFFVTCALPPRRVVGLCVASFFFFPFCPLSCCLSLIVLSPLLLFCPFVWIVIEL